jgi:hypothetical protein
MRDMGVHGLLIYCADNDAATRSPSAPTTGRMIFGCPILSRGLSAKRAASAVQMCGRISIGARSPRASWAIDKGSAILKKNLSASVFT